MDVCLAFQTIYFRIFLLFFFFLAGEMWVTNGEGIREGEIIWAA